MIKKILLIITFRGRVFPRLRPDVHRGSLRGAILLVLLGILLLSPHLLLFSQEVTAFTPIKTEDAVINSIDFKIGFDVLRYQEAEPISNTLSKSGVKNLVGNFDFYQEYQQFQWGIKGILPLNIEKNTEKWYRNDVSYQVNKLDYYWSRIDAYVGYSFKNESFTIPGTCYIGLRNSESVKHRSDFFVSGKPQNIKITEKIQSYNLFVGYKGETTLVQSRVQEWSDDFASLVLLNWRVEYHKPIFNRVTNSYIPDILFKDKSGYTTDFKVGLAYHITSDLLATFDIYGGRMYWEGSSGSGTVKWNENKTDYLGGNLGLALLF